MLDLHRLQLIEAGWEDIETSYRLAPYNAPLNRVEERQKVFEAQRNGQSYNPQFVYTPPPKYPAQSIREFMAKLEPQESWVEKLYYEKARNALLAIQCVQDHVPSVITGMSCLAYGLPGWDLLTEARRILAQVHPTDTPDQPKTLSAEDAIAWMQSVLDQSSIQEWRAIVFEPMSAKMSVNRLDKEVKIRKGVTFSPSDLHRLVVHEIGVHVLRYENGAQQPIRLFQSGFTKYLSTEEGLAVYGEAQAGLLETPTLRKYAGRVIAAHLALNHPFSHVFETLATDLGPEVAFGITVRAKRGFTDTTQPGAHTKDIVYLQGYLAVKAHLEQQPDDYPLLFAGKFGLRHIPLVRSLVEQGTVTFPPILPDRITAVQV